MKNMLLNRVTFKESVFNRDKYKCVICGKDAVDAHHIIDRSCFNDGGYYINNGVSLCSNHHLDAEKGYLSCKMLREKAGIKDIILPVGYNDAYDYDKWGKEIPNGNRKKYPHTYHLEWSEAVGGDDKVQHDITNFVGKEIVITEKMDGENTNMYRDFIHARSLDSNNHPSRNWVKGLWGSIRHNIPENWRICGENLYAKHSIFYDYLSSYFMVFNIWNENNICLCWDDTIDWCTLLGIEHVPVIYRGVFDIDYIKNIKIDSVKQEGFVIRLAESFHFDDFSKSVVKFVRKNHVQTDEHWMSQPIYPNKLKNNM